MTSLYVDRRGVSLKHDGGAITFYENNQRIGTVPMAPLERIFLKGDVQLSAGLLAKFGGNNIGVVVLSGRKSTPHLLLARPHNDASRRLTQFRLAHDHSFCLSFSKTLVHAKLKGQITTLSRLKETYTASHYTLNHCLDCIKSAKDTIDHAAENAILRGIEGHAAALYFKGIANFLAPKLNFNGRNRRPPKDPANALLSLTYTLLHSEVVIALYGAGLDPFVGFYHTIHFGRESLACDLVEPVRPLVDEWVVGLFKTEAMRPEDFSTTESGCLMGKAGRVRFYEAYENFSKTLRAHVNSSISETVDLITHSIPTDILTDTSSDYSQLYEMDEMTDNDEGEEKDD